MFSTHRVRFDNTEPRWAGLTDQEQKLALAEEVGIMMAREVTFDTPGELLALLDEGLRVTGERAAKPSPMDSVMGDTFSLVFSLYRAELLQQVPELGSSTSMSLN